MEIVELKSKTRFIKSLVQKSITSFTTNDPDFASIDLVVEVAYAW